LHKDFRNIFGFALTAAAAHGIEPGKLFAIQKGPAVLKPQLEVAQTYSDNITYRTDDKVSDLVTILSPGLKLQLGSLDYNHLELSYLFDRVEYWDNSDLSVNQHRVALSSDFQISRFRLEGADRFEILSSPLGGGISVGGAKIDRHVFQDQYRLTYEVSEKTAVYGEALHARTDYQTDIALYDSMMLEGTLGFQYLGLTRVRFFGEVYYGLTENEPNSAQLREYPQADYVGGFAGARGDFTERVTGMVKAGYESRWYSDGSEGLGTPVVDVSLTGRITDKTALIFFYSRRQRESAQFVRSSYTANAFVLNLQQQIGSDGRLRANLRAEYSRSDYDFNPQYVSGERKDDLLLASLTLTYDIKLWFRVFGGYSFEHLKSNEPSILDYDVNRVRLGMQFGY